MDVILEEPDDEVSTISNGPSAAPSAETSDADLPPPLQPHSAPVQPPQPPPPPPVVPHARVSKAAVLEAELADLARFRNKLLWYEQQERANLQSKISDQQSVLVEADRVVAQALKEAGETYTKRLRAAVSQHRDESDAMRTLSDMAGLQHREQEAVTSLEKQVEMTTARLQPLRDQFAKVKSDFEELKNALELKRAKDEAELDRLQSRRDRALRDVTAANPSPEEATANEVATRDAVAAIEAEVAAQVKRKFEALIAEEEASLGAALQEREQAVKDKALADCDAMMKQFKAEFRTKVQPQLDTLENAKSHLAAKRVTLTRQRDKLQEEVCNLQLANALGDPAALEGQAWLEDHATDAAGASLLDLAQSPDHRHAPETHNPSNALRHIHAGRRAASLARTAVGSVSVTSEPASWVAFHNSPDFKKDGTPNLAYYSVQPSETDVQQLDVSMMGLLGSTQQRRGERTDFASVRQAFGGASKPKSTTPTATKGDAKPLKPPVTDPVALAKESRRRTKGMRPTKEERLLQEELGLDVGDDSTVAGTVGGMAGLKANFQDLDVEELPEDADAVDLVKGAAEEADSHQRAALRELKLRVRHQWELLSGYDPSDVIAFLVQVHRKAPSTPELVKAYDTEFRRVKSIARIMDLRTSIKYLEQRYNDLRSKSKGLSKSAPLFERELSMLAEELDHSRKELECATLAHQRTFKERIEPRPSPIGPPTASGWRTLPPRAASTTRSPALSVVGSDGGSPASRRGHASMSPGTRFTAGHTPLPAPSPSLFDSSQAPPSTINPRSPSVPSHHHHHHQSDLAGFESF